jgi:hypothetical protein
MPLRAGHRHHLALQPAVAQLHGLACAWRPNVAGGKETSAIIAAEGIYDVPR